MPAKASSRIGQRDVAAAAGVCLMTVSLSLRDDPKISPQTRQRIRRIARELGYHPDPEISRLMQRLRTSRTSRGKSGLAIVDFYPRLDFPEHDYHRRIRNGIAARAEELGFGVNAFKAAEYKFHLHTLIKVIRSRGLEGVVLFPSVVAPVVLDPSADWTGLSVVSVTNSILSPRFHCVVPHQFANMMRLIEATTAHGFRRIGAILEETFDERTAHHFTAAMNWHGHGQRILIVPASATPAERTTLIARWISERLPDLVFAQTPATVVAAQARSRRTRKVTIGALGTPNDESYSYLDEHPEVVGAASVDLLAGMMYYHETGVPLHPRTTMIDGSLRLDRLMPQALG